MLARRKLGNKRSGIDRRRGLALFIGRRAIRLCPIRQKALVGRTACDACDHNRHARERDGREHAIGRLPPKRLNERTADSRPHHTANARKSRNQTNIEARILIKPTRDKRRRRQINKRARAKSHKHAAREVLPQLRRKRHQEKRERRHKARPANACTRIATVQQTARKWKEHEARKARKGREIAQHARPHAQIGGGVGVENSSAAMPERNGAKHAHDKREYNEEAEMWTRVPRISQRGFSHHKTPLNEKNYSAKAKTMPRRPEEGGSYA